MSEMYPDRLHADICQKLEKVDDRMVENTTIQGHSGVKHGYILKIILNTRFFDNYIISGVLLIILCMMIIIDITTTIKVLEPSMHG